MEVLFGPRLPVLHRILHQEWLYLSQIALVLLLCSPTYASYAERVSNEYESMNVSQHSTGEKLLRDEQRGQDLQFVGGENMQAGRLRVRL